ncbi:Hpt domain-containing protein [Noviherbaspirillum sedimenti]|nr:Hpt domain-containing protein [Noviherbaspirillum sedimenti]
MDTRMREADEREADELEAMRDMFGEDFAMLAELYLGDSPKRLAALQSAAAASDAAQAAKIVHSLGGSCASIGASSLAAMCQAMELDCRNGNPGNLGEQLQAIAAEYARIEARLRAMLLA